MELMMKGKETKFSDYGDTHTHTQSDIKQIKKDENVWLWHRPGLDIELPKTLDKTLPV